MRTKDEALSEQRRRDILAAAATVFKQKGFHGARTEDICAQAQASPGTVFRYFDNKNAMIQAIAMEELARYGEQLRELASQAGLRWMAQLNATDLAALLTPSEFELGSDSWLELSRNPPGRAAIELAHKDLHNALAAALTQGQKAGWVRSGIHPSGVATLILALLTGLGFDTELNLPMDQAATAKALADFFGEYVLTPLPPAQPHAAGKR